MNKVLITLTPIGKFFFGGDNTFEVVKNGRVINSEFSSYIIHSNYFPQQTTLLGMLRFLILSHSDAFDENKQLIINNKVAEDLIGKGSFLIGKKDGYGTIKSIGTCFIQRKEYPGKEIWENLLVAPKDHLLKVNFTKTTQGLFNSINLSVPEIMVEKGQKLSPYNPKEPIELHFLTMRGEKIPFSSVFTEDRRVGINKEYSGVTNDASYFKQISYCLGKKDSGYRYRFAFMAETTGELSVLNGSIVSLGGDSSQFSLNIEPYIEPDLKILNSGMHERSRVVLTSNAFVQMPISFDFAIADTHPFRFLKTTIETKDYNILSQEAKRSNEKFELYESGSVFYFNNPSDVETFTKQLTSHEEFYQIGYNHYQVFTNN